jgi:hypothetical protein
MIRRFSAIAVAVAVLVVGLIGLIAFKQYLRSPDAPVSRSGDLADIPLPTTSSSNAADSYRQAVELFATFSPADLDQIDQYADGKIDGRAAEFYQRHARVLGWVRQGAVQPLCDWGQPVIGPRLTSLNTLRGIASLIWGHARFAEQSGNVTIAVDDLLSAIAMARHIGMNRLMVDSLVQIGIENPSVESIARNLPRLPHDQLTGLSRRLDALPKPITGQQLLLGEFDHAQRSIRDQQAGFVAVSMVDSLKAFYTDLGAVIDIQSPDEFIKSVEAKLDEYKHNTFAQTAGPSLKRFREPMALVQVRLAMLRCAIDVLVEGESAVASSRDPFSNGTPFTYTKTERGFILTSKLTDHGKPATLIVGGFGK